VQVGTPQELYRHPNSIFVAHFIGESNFLEGIVSTASNGDLEIELRGGFKVTAVGKGLKNGERVILAVRPEVLTVEKGETEKENTLIGKVEKISFEGTFVRYVVRLGSQDSIVAIKPSLAGDWFNVGEKITMCFQPEKTHVFAYPAAGLMEETAV